ncbi:MAG: hypothetical protein ACR2G6_02925 [Gemmatimonadaceae bacterium]
MTLVHVPEVFVSFPELALTKWKAAQPEFDVGGRKRYSLYGDYASLGREGRFLLPYRGSPTKRFPEFFTALSLQREGFDCWGQVQLFDDLRPLFVNREAVRRGKGNAVRNTIHVRDEMPWRWKWPSDIQRTLAFQPRNPDIVAFDAGRAEWLFCEVKGPDDRCSGEHFEEQLKTLTVLHLLTRSPVAIVRPVDARTPTPMPRTYKARLKYRHKAPLDWIVAR